jgi:hypothetical protein
LEQRSVEFFDVRIPIKEFFYDAVWNKGKGIVDSFETSMK